ncbi:hypothetical protein SAMN05443549_104268 [Flavobacterium fluvii]|uniref:Uncharacterized protein n=1 Tax=Flavobacterium fluvii TaxID=468056 RepID=A0A1M5KE14_9FLAO|nr:hypothetical protein [Flavobacterium fluvii]SHG50719.1 hypothetical protein SAMN05443549_104268 [Flavobacterium fluvii]
MKTSVIYLIVISFLFQSCYTYRTIDLKDSSLVVGKNYKIRQDAKFAKSKMVLVNDSTITVEEGSIQKEIPISEISEIKEGEFSTLKTVGLVLGIGLVVLGVVGAIAVESMGDMSFEFPADF